MTSMAFVGAATLTLLLVTVCFGALLSSMEYNLSGTVRANVLPSRPRK